MVELIELAAELIAGIRSEVTAAELPEMFGRAVGEAMRIIPPGSVAGPVVAVYHRPYGETFDVTIGVPVSGHPAGDGLDMVELPAGPALRVVHRGPYPQLSDAYAELGAALADRGLALTIAWERYVVGPGDVGDPADYVTEVVAPLP